MPPAYVKRHKNDAADAEDICEAVTRATLFQLQKPDFLGIAGYLWPIVTTTRAENATPIAIKPDKQ
jgi:hypothetical protein